MKTFHDYVSLPPPLGKPHLASQYHCLPLTTTKQKASLGPRTRRSIARSDNFAVLAIDFALIYFSTFSFLLIKEMV